MVKPPSPWTALAREFCVEADFDWHDAAECPMCLTLARFAERVAQAQRAQIADRIRALATRQHAGQDAMVRATVKALLELAGE